jgi:hypothetical protein
VWCSPIVSKSHYVWGVAVVQAREQRGMQATMAMSACEMVPSTRGPGLDCGRCQSSVGLKEEMP